MTHLSQELPFMDVQIGTADTTCSDLDLHQAPIQAESATVSYHLHQGAKPSKLEEEERNLERGCTMTSFSRRVGTGISTMLYSSGLEYLLQEVDLLLAILLLPRNRGNCTA